MHDELCRKCGGMLTNWSLCSECRKPIKRICLQCGIYTEERVHNVCFYHVDTLQAGPHTAFGTLTNGRKKDILRENNGESEQLLNEIA